ncbi:MAG: helix-turn-helix transcriptional regulator [Oscillospiraceae bacterium]|nr:helix-turn-helix transcriptional regulator [Oscillospiraceae bacterium]
MISYRPMWETMRRRNITTYTLVEKFKFSKGTLHSLKHDRNISTATLDDICRILDCNVEDVLVYIPDQKDD